jgi:hypothetical protein
MEEGVAQHRVGAGFRGGLSLGIHAAEGSTGRGRA